MKITLKEAMDMHGALSELGAEKHTNMVLMFRISHNLKQLKSIGESYDEAQKSAVDKFAAKDDKGELKATPDGRGVIIADTKGFADAMKPLLEQEVEVMGLKTIPWSILQKSTVEKEDKIVPLAVRGAIIEALGVLVEGEPSEA